MSKNNDIMTKELTQEEADEAARKVIPEMEEWFQSIFKRGYLRINDIGEVVPSVRRAGSTADTYCKIAGATLRYGVATDLRKDTKDNMVLSFRRAKQNEIPPSKEVCLARWNIIKNLPFDKVRSFNYEENPVDTLDPEKAELILKRRL